MNAKRIERAIQRIACLDAKIRPIMASADNILASSAMGQAPPVYGRTLDKAVKLRKQAAAIWNDELRNQTGPDGRSFWQMAIAAGLPVRRFGREEQLDITADDIRGLLHSAAAAAYPPLS